MSAAQHRRSEGHYDAERRHRHPARPAAGRRSTCRELWDYRELLYFLVWRDMKIRYKQTAIGVALGRAPAAARRGDLHRRLRPLRAPADERRPVRAHGLRRRCCPGCCSRTRSTSRRRASSRTRRSSPRSTCRACYSRSRRCSRGSSTSLVGCVFLVGADGVRTASRRRRSRCCCCRSLVVFLSSLTRGRGDALALRAQRALPRRAVHGAVPDAGVVLRDAGRLLGARRSRQDVRAVDRAQSDGRRRPGRSAGRCSATRRRSGQA